MTGRDPFRLPCRFAAALVCALLAVAATPAVAASSFTLRDVTLVSGGTTYRAAELALTDSALSQAETEALLRDDGRPVAQRWATLTAARIVAPALVSETTSAGAGQTIVYRDVVLQGVTAGRVARMEATGATATVRDGQSGAVAVEIGALAFEGVDLPAMAHIVADGRATPDEPLRTMVASGRVDGLAMTLPTGATVRIGAITLQELGGRALAVPMTSLVDLTPKPDGGPPSPERQDALLLLLTDLLTSQSVARIALADITLTPPDAAATTVKAAAFTVEDVRDGRIGRIVLDSLAFADAGGAGGTVRQLQVRGLDLQPRLRTSPAEKLRATAPVTVERIALDGFAATVGRVGTPFAISIANAAIDASAWRELGPAALSIGVDHLAFDLPLDEPKLRPLIDLGYKRIDLSLTTDAAFDAERSELALNAIRVSVPTVGGIDLSALMSKVSPTILGPDREGAYAALMGSLFKRATAGVTDDGLLLRLIETQARQTGTAATDVREQWAAAVRAAVLSALADNPDRDAVASAAARFVREGGRLTLAAEAPGGLSALDVMLAGGLTGVLGRLRLTAGQ